MACSGKNNLLLHWIFIFLSAIACLTWLLLIPGDIENAFFLGLSSRRLILALILLLGMLGSATLVAQEHTTPGQWGTRINVFLSDRPVVCKVLSMLSAAGMLIGLTLLWLPSDRLNEYKYAFARLKPLIAWAAVICLQIILIMGRFHYQKYRSTYAVIQADFRASCDSLHSPLAFFPWLLGGGFAGAILALAFRQVGSELIVHRDWLPVAALAFGVCLLLAGLLYNRSLVFAIPYCFASLVLLGCLLNISFGQADATRFNARLSLLSGNDAVSLGQRYHYSLSVYHVLSKLYPDCRMIVSPGLLKEWNLTEARLATWIPAAAIYEIQYDPAISEAEAEQVMILNPIRVDINTSGGTRIYNFVPSNPTEPSPVVLVYHDKQRFFIPINTFSELFPQRELLP